MYWMPFMLGFVGSLHCVLMCGPITLTLNKQPTISKFVQSRIIYNFGRIFTYTIIGVIFGLIGEFFVITGYQQSFSISLGVLMILLTGIYYFNFFNFQNHAFSHFLYLKIKKMIATLLGHTSSIQHSFLLGVANGFLPCGLVYTALAGALATHNVYSAMQYMIVFGLGTFPAMLFVSITGEVFRFLSRINTTKWATVFVGTLGVLLILRGLDLDIPYLSPTLSYLYPNVGIRMCE